MKTVNGLQLILAGLVVTACATGQNARSTAPAVTLTQTDSLPRTRVDSVSGLPLNYQLSISNPFAHAVTLVSVEVESVGRAGAYEMKRVRHAFERVIPANTTDTIAIRAWVQPLQVDTGGGVSNPVILRGQARFESSVGVMRRNFTGRVQ